MPRFAANLSMMYTEHGFLERFGAAAKDGFDAVEFLFPYAHGRSELAGRLADHGLAQVLFNAPPGDWDAGERGMACLPGREAQFREGVDLALEFAAALKCPRIHLMAGLAPAGADRAALRATYVANLAWAAKQAASAGVDVLIEPINTRDIPRFFLNRQDEAHAIVQEVGARQPEGADGPVPLPDRRGRPREEDRAVPADRPRRPLPDRRRARRVTSPTWAR